MEPWCEAKAEETLRLILRHCDFRHAPDTDAIGAQPCAFVSTARLVLRTMV